MSVLDRASARRFAERWIDSWNRGDLEEILAYDRDDFEMRACDGADD